MPGPRLVYIEQVPLYMTIGAWEKEQDCRWPPLDGDNDKTRKKQDDARSWAAFIANMRAKHFDGADYRDASMMGISSKMPIPDIFLACREAYNASAIHYKRIFVTSRPNAYFNFETDTLCLDWYNISNTQWDGNVPNHFDLWKGFRQEDVKDIRKVRNLALRLFLDYDEPFQAPDVANVLEIFHGVNNMAIVLQRDGDPSDVETSGPVVIDDVDVDETIDNYPHWLREVEAEDFHVGGDCGMVEPPEVQMIELQENQTIDSAELEALQVRSGRWAVPQIRYKMTIAQDLNHKYERVKKAGEVAYNAIKDRVESEGCRACKKLAEHGEEQVQEV